MYPVSGECIKKYFWDTVEYTGNGVLLCKEHGMACPLAMRFGKIPTLGAHCMLPFWTGASSFSPLQLRCLMMKHPLFVGFPMHHPSLPTAAENCIPLPYLWLCVSLPQLC